MIHSQAIFSPNLSPVLLSGLGFPSAVGCRDPLGFGMEEDEGY